jgi:chromosomal replication initiation ATPase DnaA
MKNHATLENFISIDNNLNAKNTAIEFAHGKLTNNVLTISSSLGNGATHLAFAILNEIENQNKSKEIFYTSFEKILADFKNKNFQELFNNHFFQNHAAILIDSYYETLNQTKAKELIDVLKNATTKIIFTCTNGVIIPIDSIDINLVTPSKIEKENIIRNILKKENQEFGPEIINYIASQEKLSVRDIEALIVSAMARSFLLKSDIDLDLVKECNKRIFA